VKLIDVTKFRIAEREEQVSVWRPRNDGESSLLSLEALRAKMASLEGRKKRTEMMSSTTS